MRYSIENIKKRVYVKSFKDLRKVKYNPDAELNIHAYAKHNNKDKMTLDEVFSMFE